MMFENNRDYEILFRSVNLTFKYKFGKIDFDPIKKKAILENNDTTHDHDDDYYPDHDHDSLSAPCFKCLLSGSPAKLS